MKLFVWPDGEWCWEDDDLEILSKSDDFKVVQLTDAEIEMSDDDFDEWILKQI